MNGRTDPLSLQAGDVYWVRPECLADLANRQGAAWNNKPSASVYGPNPSGMLNACRPEPEPAGHRVTLTRPRFLRSPLVITTNANPSHADALRDLRHQFKATTGREYLPRRGDLLNHEVTA